MQVRFLPEAPNEKGMISYHAFFILSFVRQESNWKGVGETLVSPRRKGWENLGFPRGEIARRPAGSTKVVYNPLVYPAKPIHS